MNKQALAFLTMFSLVLMLSVYYVTLPSDSTSVMSNQTASGEQEDSKDSEQENTSKQDNEKKDSAEELQDQIDHKKETQINDNNQVVADKDSEEKDKEDALSTMEEVKSEQQLQTDIKNALTKQKLNSAVEIKDTTCTITIFDTKADKKTAANIMKTAKDIVKNQYLIEVAFK